MDPLGQKPGKDERQRHQDTDDDRKPSAATQRQASSDQLQIPQPPTHSMASSSSSSTAAAAAASVEVMRRLVDNRALPAGNTTTVSGYGEQQLRQHQQHSTTVLGPVTTSERFLASLQMQALLRQQEEALRNTRLLLQLVSGESHATADTVATRLHHDVPVAALAATTELAATTGLAAASNDASDALWRQILSDAAISVEAAPNSVSIEGSTVNTQSTALAASPTEISNQETLGDANNNIKPSADEASFCPDEDELSDEAYFKDFDKEDSHKLNNETFPFRLYRMLFELEKSGIQDIASFASKGQVFVVHKPKRFVEVRRGCG